MNSATLARIAELEKALAEAEGERDALLKAETELDNDGWMVARKFEVQLAAATERAESAEALCDETERVHTMADDVRKERLGVAEAQRDKLAGTVRFLLPMAKGYAHEHPVGRNQEMCNDASAALAALEGEGKHGE